MRPALERKSYIEDRVFKDPNSGCWLWEGALSKEGGYGAAWGKGKCIRAHRLSYLTFVGPIPEGLVIMHKCDTPSCVNPGHLRAGTASDNMRDSGAKGRRYFQLHPERSHLYKLHARGPDNRNSKLTHSQYAEILSSPIKNNSELARWYGVAPATIWRIRNAGSR